MTICELLSLFPADSSVQINIITGPGQLSFIPSPGYFQERSHWKTMQELGTLPVKCLNIETEEVDGQHYLLLMINEEVHS